VLPDQLSIPRAHEAFDAAGALVDAKHAATLQALTRKLVETTSRLAPVR